MQGSTLPLGAIKPAGWLRRQLEIQAAGLSGHLDEFWPDIKESGWIGGSAEGWERAPYWLDGLVPLAFLLEDDALIAKVDRWIGYILDHRAEDGWLGPQEQEQQGFRSKRDPWPLFVMLKVLTQYAEARGEDARGTRTHDAIVDALRAITTHIDRTPLFSWNQYRWADLLVTILWCRRRGYAPWMDVLAERIHNQGYDWDTHFSRFPFTDRSDRWTFDRHVVNNAMGVKTPGLWELFTTGSVSTDAVLRPISVLDEHHGQATGMFSGDECFAGRMPSQGTELCAVVEYLYSLEQLLPHQPDVRISDRLERIAYNALPAPFSPDMWAHQYDQQVNQAQCVVTDDRIYTTNRADANLYGLEPHFGCCTANMHQGFPKLATSLWVTTADGALRATTYAPCEVTIPAGAGVGSSGRAAAESHGTTKIRVETEYPLREDVLIAVDCSHGPGEPGVGTTIELPIPSWAEGATVSLDGAAPAPIAPGTVRRVEIGGAGRHEIRLRLPMRVRVEFRYNGAASIFRGPLLFALHPQETWSHLRGEHPHSDWEVTPASPWAYAIGLTPGPSFGLAAQESGQPARAITDLMDAGPLAHRDGSDDSVREAPVRIPVKVKRCAGWSIERGAAAEPPQSPTATEGPEETAWLVPYGSTGLRLAEIPWYWSE
jgi:hypothetical protein